MIQTITDPSSKVTFFKNAPQFLMFPYLKNFKTSAELHCPFTTNKLSKLCPENSNKLIHVLFFSRKLFDISLNDHFTPTWLMQLICKCLKVLPCKQKKIYMHHKLDQFFSSYKIGNFFFYLFKSMNWKAKLALLLGHILG